MKTSAKFKIGNEVLTLVLPTEMEAHYHTAEQKLNKPNRLLFRSYGAYKNKGTCNS
jgi:hypothetical protein